MEIDLEDLRADLHQAVEEVLSRYQPSSVREISPSEQLNIHEIKSEVEPWVYQWPHEPETFTLRTWYDVTQSDRAYSVLVAWCVRHAWGKLRKRSVIFGVSGKPGAESYYPWTEFVEADDGRFVSAIPDPLSPRATLTDGDAIPAELEGAVIRRSDESFASVKNGPSLRLVLDEDDEEGMIRHALWVATLRGRLAGNAR